MPPPNGHRKGEQPAPTAHPAATIDNDRITSPVATVAFNAFNWSPQPIGWKIITDLVAEFLAHAPAAAVFATRMKDELGSRFVDWLDHLSVPENAALRRRLLAAGFTHEPSVGAKGRYVHHGAMFPEVLVGEDTSFIAALKVESVSDFLAANGIHDAQVEGLPGAQVRLAPVFLAKGHELWVIERHGLRGHEWPSDNPTPVSKIIKAQQHLENFRRRRRDFETDVDGFVEANRLVDAAISDIGRDWACDLWFYSEREYWQRRNRAAQFLKTQHDRFGLGWANHDHHTYRSSREWFKHLIAFLEKLGFHCRERFYAGAEAGWGAQVIEHPVAGITIFADVDMSPEELMGDFPHIGLGPQNELGTVGLWCALHGEAFLQAGMHHLECQFDFHALRDLMWDEGQIHTMDPFTTFPYLRQAFTDGERWPVAERRLKAVLARRQITPEQADLFRKNGAVGSHLENLERNDGFKGFNQSGVSQIIAKTDPRRLAAALQPTGA
ncbi:MAG: hypothetical protein ACT4PL_00340 [Phycisphaerales bacterium]